MASWKTRKRDPAKVQALINELNIQEPLAAILVGRGYDTPAKAKAFLQPGAYYHPSQIPGLPQAARLIVGAVQSRQRILLAGDFDADGLCGVAVLSHLLTALGTPVSHYIPSRKDGYGFSREAVDLAVQHGAKLIVTVDVGITDRDACDYAHKRGIPVVVTDHHEPRGPLPYAAAVVNLKADQGNYPFRELCGAGVAFKLAQLVAINLGLETLPESCLSLAAIATVADGVPLVGENRFLVRAGLARLQKRCPTWLQVLVDNTSPLVTSELIAYYVAPAINAAGRIDRPYLALDMLIAHEDDPEAGTKAQDLKKCNEQRKELLVRAEEECAKQLPDPGDTTDSVLVIEGNFEPGIVGILASRIAERYQRPTLVVGAGGRGSGRAPEGVDILSILEGSGDAISDYGGHQQACGFQISLSVDALRGRIGELVVPPAEEPIVEIDLELPPDKLTAELVKAIMPLEPFGAGNPPVQILLRGLSMQRAELVGKGKNHLKLKHGKNLGIVGFGLAHLAGATQPIDCAVTVAHDGYWGPPKVSATIQSFGPSPVSLEQAS